MADVALQPSRRPMLVTVSGPDVPGVTADVTAVLDAHGVGLLDVEQVTVQGHLVLCLLLEPAPEDGVLKDLLFAAKRHGLDLDFDTLSPEPPNAAAPDRIAITAIADPITPAHLQGIAGVLVAHDANIRAIERLSERGLEALEVRVELRTSRAGLKHDLLAFGLSHGVDIAVQREGLTRRSKRLAVMDMDSTLIQVEVIDELARSHGVYEQVQRMTADAMAGQLDYAESLRRRVALLEGLPADRVQAIADDLPLTPGAERLVRVLKRLGLKTAVISGGFDIAAKRVQQRLGLDHAHSNRLEVVDGVLTGRVVPPLVTPERKVALLEELAALEGIPLDQTLAIGDGANDLMMIERAGLGIAFHAKATLRRAADTTLSAGGLDRVLYLLGVRADEV